MPDADDNINKNNKNQNMPDDTNKKDKNFTKSIKIKKNLKKRE